VRWKTEREKQGGHTRCLTGRRGGRRRPDSVETADGNLLGLVAPQWFWRSNRWSSGEIGTRMRHGKYIGRREDHMSMLTTDWDELERSN
jgi:hypothetical protein